MKTIFAVFLLIPMTTGLKSYACNGPTNGKCTEHNITCVDKDKRINIISGYYVFIDEYVSRHTCCFKGDHDSEDDDCRPIFEAADQSNLIDSCKGKRTCNYRTPILYDVFCRTMYHAYEYYTYSYIQYECLPVTTTLPTTSEQVTRLIHTDKSTIQSTEQHYSKPAKPTESYTSEDRTERTEIILNTMSMPLSKNTRVDTAVIAGSVVGCILLVMLLITAVVVILKGKTMRTFIDSHFKGGPRVTNPVYETPITNPVYETPSNGYNKVVFKNDNSPSVNVVKSDDYNHLHDAKNDNPMTTGNTYNHLGPMMGNYNNLPANNNSDHVNEHADGAYNHLGMANNERHSSEERHNANYNHIGGSKVDKSDVDYNHLHGSKGEIPKTDYNHLGEIKKTEIPNDYNHIRSINIEKVVDNYHHLGNVNKPVLNDDDYNHIGEAKHGTIVRVG